MTTAIRLLRLTGSTVSAYVAHKAIAQKELPWLIGAVFGVLCELETRPSARAVAISSSIAPDYLVCLEDGRKLKTLKRARDTM